MSGLTVSSKTTPYSTGGTNGTSSSTTVSRSSSSTTISNKVSSTTPNTTGVTASTTTVTKTTGAVTSSTTTAYGASNTNSVVRFISSSTTVSKNVSSTTPSVSSSTTVRSNVSSTTPSVSSGTPNLIDSVKKLVENILASPEPKPILVKEALSLYLENLNVMEGHKTINEQDIDFGQFLKLMDQPTTEIVDDVFSNINNEISSRVIDNVKNFLSNDIKYTEKFNIFNIEMGTMLSSFKYYGDIEVSGGGTDANLEVENLIRESMNEFFNIKELAVSFGNKEATLEMDELEVWCVLKDEDEEIKLNLTKLTEGKCNMAYERTYTLAEGEKGEMSWVLGMEIDIDLTKNISADLKESYEYSKEAWVSETVTSHIEEYENEGSWFNGDKGKNEAGEKFWKGFGNVIWGLAIGILGMYIPSIVPSLTK